MKNNSNEAILLVGAILFWAVALPAASLFFTVAVLWDKIETSTPRGQLVPWGEEQRCRAKLKQSRPITHTYRRHLLLVIRNLLFFLAILRVFLFWKEAKTNKINEQINHKK